MRMADEIMDPVQIDVRPSNLLPILMSMTISQNTTVYANAVPVHSTSSARVRQTARAAEDRREAAAGVHLRARWDSRGLA